MRAISMKLGRNIVAAAIMAPVALAQVNSAAPQNTSANGTLVVSQSGRGPLENEGSISFFQIAVNGKVIDEKPLGAKFYGDFGRVSRHGTSDGDKETFNLPPGSYELRSYVRGCDGNCISLGPPYSECKDAFQVGKGESVKAVRKQKLSGTCTIAIKYKGK